ncbi:MAG TPA: pyrroline-5-carboxylate reductase, partial [Clostridia bacterium]
ILKGLEHNFDGKILVSTLNYQNISQNYPNADFVCNNQFLAQNCQYILFAVKPKDAYNIFDEIEPFISQQNIIISIMAGIKISTIIKRLPKVGAVARVMPNLAAKINQSCSGIAFFNATQEIKDNVAKIFDNIGKVIFIDESKMDAVTGVSGSGIAYVYYFIQSLIDAGQSIGLTLEESKDFALQTVLGGVEMIKHFENQDINDMIDAVCSKGGTTIEAIEVLKKCNFKEIIMQAVSAAYEKSKILSRD